MCGGVRVNPLKREDEDSIFHLILLGIPSILILSVKNRAVCLCVGWGSGGDGGGSVVSKIGGCGGLLNRQNLLSMTKVFWQTLRAPHPPAGFDKSLYVGTFVYGKIYLKSMYRTLPYSQRTTSSWIEYPAHLNENYIFQFFLKMHIWKATIRSYQFFYFLLFYITRYHFYNFLELHSTL